MCVMETCAAPECRKLNDIGVGKWTVFFSSIKITYISFWCIIPWAQCQRNYIGRKQNSNIRLKDVTFFFHGAYFSTTRCRNEGYDGVREHWENVLWDKGILPGFHIRADFSSFIQWQSHQLGRKTQFPTSEQPSHWVNRQHLWRNLLKRNRLESFWCFLLLILKSEPGARHRILRMLHSLQDLKLWRTLNQGVYCYISKHPPPSFLLQCTTCL